MRIINQMKYLYALDKDIKCANLEQLQLLRDKINGVLGCNETSVKSIGVAFAAVLILMGATLSSCIWGAFIIGEDKQYDNYVVPYITYLVLFMISLMTSIEYFAKGFFSGMLAFISICIIYIAVAISSVFVALNGVNSDFKLVNSLFALTGLAFESLALFVLIREGSLGVMLRFSRNRVLKKILILERSPAKKRRG